jgi:hypothetical protein
MSWLTPFLKPSRNLLYSKPHCSADFKMRKSSFCHQKTDVALGQTHRIRELFLRNQVFKEQVVFIHIINFQLYFKSFICVGHAREMCPETLVGVLCSCGRVRSRIEVVFEDKYLPNFLEGGADARKTESPDDRAVFL